MDDSSTASPAAIDRLARLAAAARAIAARPRVREDARLFALTYAAGFLFFMAWLA